jgi:hypothetical protein
MDADWHRSPYRPPDAAPIVCDTDRAALKADCHPCVTEVCRESPFCCVQLNGGPFNKWQQFCASRAVELCGVKCPTIEQSGGILPPPLPVPLPPVLPFNPVPVPGTGPLPLNSPALAPAVVDSATDMAVSSEESKVKQMRTRGRRPR